MSELSSWIARLERREMQRRGNVIKKFNFLDERLSIDRFNCSDFESRFQTFSSRNNYRRLTVQNFRNYFSRFYSFWPFCKLFMKIHEFDFWWPPARGGAPRNLLFF